MKDRVNLPYELSIQLDHLVCLFFVVFFFFLFFLYDYEVGKWRGNIIRRQT